MSLLKALAKSSGVASVELGVAAPVLITLCVGVCDFSLVYHRQLQLSAVLGAGAEYAFTQGQSESGTTLTSDVTSFVQAISSISLSSVNASYNGGNAAGNYYCVSGSPAVFSGPYSSGASCTDGSTAGKFISISASYTYTPLFSADTAFLPTTFTQSVIVRLQ